MTPLEKLLESIKPGQKKEDKPKRKKRRNLKIERLRESLEWMAKHT